MIAPETELSVVFHLDRVWAAFALPEYRPLSIGDGADFGNLDRANPYEMPWERFYSLLPRAKYNNSLSRAYACERVVQYGQSEFAPIDKGGNSDRPPPCPALPDPARLAPTPLFIGENSDRPPLKSRAGTAFLSFWGDFSQTFGYTLAKRREYRQKWRDKTLLLFLPLRKG